jgi:hypothetical protein
MPRSLSLPLHEAGTEAATSYPAELLERLHQTARIEINRHININGRCAVCTVVFRANGRNWPKWCSGRFEESSMSSGKSISAQPASSDVGSRCRRRGPVSRTGLLKLAAAWDSTRCQCRSCLFKNSEERA